ncbi:MAG: DUF86 domain-containing protein [Candidatus Methylomirabilis sp.]|nr:DUF86 domain-containing protein [Candidatus Methylomirabilis sp.]
MQRDVRAYLFDIIESCEAISAAVAGLDLESYRSNRLVRSSVEREFIIIGEATNVLSRLAPDIFAELSHARRIIDFRNQLTHEYPSINDKIVWTTATRDVPVLRSQCKRLLNELEPRSAV